MAEIVLRTSETALSNGQSELSISSSELPSHLSEILLNLQALWCIFSEKGYVDHGNSLSSTLKLHLLNSHVKLVLQLDIFLL